MDRFEIGKQEIIFKHCAGLCSAKFIYWSKMVPKHGMLLGHGLFGAK